MLKGSRRHFGKKTYRCCKEEEGASRYLGLKAPIELRATRTIGSHDSPMSPVGAETGQDPSMSRSRSRSSITGFLIAQNFSWACRVLVNIARPCEKWSSRPAAAAKKHQGADTGVLRILLNEESTTFLISKPQSSARSPYIVC